MRDAETEPLVKGARSREIRDAKLGGELRGVRWRALGRARRKDEQSKQAGEASSGAARDQIRAVGSSTVYPFTTAVAEQFARKNVGFKAPIVESTGTGAGMKLFCGGVGTQYPDVQNASRQIKKSELDDCIKTVVTPA